MVNTPDVFILYKNGNKVLFLLLHRISSNVFSVNTTKYRASKPNIEGR